MMTHPANTAQALDREFLSIRAKLLEIAATLDRIDRAGGASAEDGRVSLIRQAVATLLRPDDDRAEQIQLLFSRPYDDEWQEKLLVDSR
jgi:hypothetical protein